MEDISENGGKEREVTAEIPVRSKDHVKRELTVNSARERDLGN